MPMQRACGCLRGESCRECDAAVQRMYAEAQSGQGALAPAGKTNRADPDLPLPSSAEAPADTMSERKKCEIVRSWCYTHEAYATACEKAEAPADGGLEATLRQLRGLELNLR